MTDAINRMETALGRSVTSMIGPVDVHSRNLAGSMDSLIWGTSVYNATSIDFDLDSEPPSSLYFRTETGQITLNMSIGEGWQAYAEIEAEAAAHIGYHWQVETDAGPLGGDAVYIPDNGDGKPVWYFATPPSGNGGSFPVSIEAENGTEHDEFQVKSIRFFLFR